MDIVNETGLKVVVIPSDAAAPGHSAVVLIKGTFELVPDGPCVALPEEAQLEPSGDVAHMDALGRSPRWSTDLAPFKPHTDCFVLGTAYAPNRVTAGSFRAGFRLGPLAKEVQIWGPRRWLPDGSATAPLAVARVPLRWELSFGGMANPHNPFGTGQDAGEDGVVMLPQIEGVAQGVRNRGDAPEPVNLGPVPVWFPERAAKVGTRDQRWALFRAPLPPLDFDPSIHNAAPFDQQAGNYPRGNEPVVLTNLHPQIGVLKTALPGLRPRVVVVRRAGWRRRRR